MKRDLLAQEGVDVVRIDHLKRRRARYVQSPLADEYCFPTCRAVRDLEPDDLVFLRDEREAEARSLTPCSLCRPLTPGRLRLARLAARSSSSVRTPLSTSRSPMWSMSSRISATCARATSRSASPRK